MSTTAPEPSRGLAVAVLGLFGLLMVACLGGLLLLSVPAHASETTPPPEPTPSVQPEQPVTPEPEPEPEPEPPTGDTSTPTVEPSSEPEPSPEPTSTLPADTSAPVVVVWDDSQYQPILALGGALLFFVALHVVAGFGRGRSSG